MKKFIITIDTEGDNLWDWKPGDKITTENTLYLSRFQNLSNKYGFKPVWLSNYEMLSDTRFVEFASKVENDKSGEIGMHLHAWSTPPDYDLPVEKNGAPYLIEYPSDIMEEKIVSMTNIIKEHIGINPVSHRAGRWAMNDKYIELLLKYGYKVDCSVTPHIDWSDNDGQTKLSRGSDYSMFPEKPYIWNGIKEVPVTVKNTHRFFSPVHKSPKKYAGAAYRAFKGSVVWLRPTGNNLKEMLWLVDSVAQSDSDYIMFMLHSSEMMPGGSPTFKTNEAIEKMYSDVEAVFKKASSLYEGITLREYIK